jgi:AcrR family transcriptional regulator
MSDTNRQARAEETRRQLLAAARVTFGERGYGGTTVAAITEQADTAHGTFYLYFRNKEDVFVHVISDVLEDLYRESFAPVEELDEGFDPLVLRQRIAAFLAVVALHGRLWRALLEGALASPVIEEHWMAGRLRFREAIAERWRHRQHIGTIDIDFDVAVAADALGSMLEWYAFGGAAFDRSASSRTGPPVDDERVIDTLTQVWMSVVRGRL